MATFGKVLAGFNILAALVFLCLAALDWGKRTDAQYQVFRGELLLHGLPLDDKDPGHRNPDDGPLVGYLSKRLLTETFTQARGNAQLGGGEVKTLKEEVTRVKNQVNSAISAGTDEAQKKAIIRGFLLEQVGDGAARDKLAERLDPASSESSADLQKDLDKLFDDALSDEVPAVPSDTPKGQTDKELKRLQIARLLTFLAPKDADWQHRVAVVVGLKAYTAALDRQGAALAAMVDRARMILRRDQNNFLGAYQSYVSLLRNEADAVAAIDRRIAEEKILLNEQRVIADDLKKRVAEFEKKLADQRADTTKALAQQEALERQIFEVQQKIVQTQDAIAHSEQQLRDLEAKKARPVSR
jgi:hypothetical protein